MFTFSYNGTCGQLNGTRQRVYRLFQKNTIAVVDLFPVFSRMALKIGRKTGKTRSPDPTKKLFALCHWGTLFEWTQSEATCCWRVVHHSSTNDHYIGQRTLQARNTGKPLLKTYSSSACHVQQWRSINPFKRRSTLVFSLLSGRQFINLLEMFFTLLEWSRQKKCAHWPWVDKN